MRILVALFIIICLASCQKDSPAPVDSSYSNLIGTWNWTSTSGGFAPSVTPTTEGYTMKLVLTANFRYTKYKNATITKSGTYNIEKQGDYDYMIFDSDPGLLINLSSITHLDLGSNAACGPKYSYEKVLPFD